MEEAEASLASRTENKVHPRIIGTGSGGTALSLLLSLLCALPSPGSAPGSLSLYSLWTQLTGAESCKAKVTRRQWINPYRTDIHLCTHLLREVGAYEG